MTRLVVADTTVWSNFAHARQPGLVEIAFPGVASPPAVLAEIAHGQRLGYLSDFDGSLVEEIGLTEEELKRAEDLEASLDPGEAACIAVAEARNALLLTDDRAARRVARALSLQVSGTLGVLVRLVDGGRLSTSEADDLLGRMLRAGFRSPVSSIVDIL